MPNLCMLIGVPGAGKSTWISKQQFDWDTTMLLSTDAIIDRIASEQGKTYSEVFKDAFKQADSEMNQNLRDALALKMDIVWDQTNLTAKSRMAKLSKIPHTYHRTGVFFPTPPLDELMQRLASRPGKIIPNNIIMGMMSQLQEPTDEEGFHQVVRV